jgi:hypothetical protein
MKAIYYILFALMALTSCSRDCYVFSSFHEPANEGLRFLWSDDGKHWDSIPGVWLRPDVGKQRVMRDPSIIRTPDGMFRLVWTSSWRGDLGFGYAESRDLRHWTPGRLVNVMTDTTTVNVWAPELFYDDVRGEAMVVWASCVPGKFARGIEDEKNNHRLYYSTTRDFRTFTPARLLMDPGYSVIDATLVKRGPGDYVMVVKDNTRNERNIKISFAKDPHGPWSAPSAPFTESFTEGPAVAQLANGYMIYYDRYRTHDFGAQFTRDFIHFDDQTSRVTVPPLHKHGTIFKAPRRLVKQLLRHPKPSTTDKR